MDKYNRTNYWSMKISYWFKTVSTNTVLWTVTKLCMFFMWNAQLVYKNYTTCQVRGVGRARDWQETGARSQIWALVLPEDSLCTLGRLALLPGIKFLFCKMKFWMITLRVPSVPHRIWLSACKTEALKVFSVHSLCSESPHVIRVNQVGPSFPFGHSTCIQTDTSVNQSTLFTLRKVILKKSTSNFQCK